MEMLCVHIYLNNLYIICPHLLTHTLIFYSDQDWCMELFYACLSQVLNELIS